MDRMLLIMVVLFICGIDSFSQGRAEDYRRADEWSSRTRDAVYDIPSRITWNEEGDHFWYEKNTSSGKDFVLIHPESRSRSRFFEISALTRALSDKLERKISSDVIHANQIKWVNTDTIGLDLGGYSWLWNRKDEVLIQKGNSTPRRGTGRYWGQQGDDSQGQPVESPDGSMVAFIRNNNIYVAEKSNIDSARPLTFDGNVDEYYAANLQWSPDGQKIAGYKSTKVETRILTLIESSPSDQLQPKLHTRDYRKPGDALPQRQPVIYNLDLDSLFSFDHNMISNQYSVHKIKWWSDSRGITFEYNQRGHQQYAVAELDANNGSSRFVIDERSGTFIDYSGKYFRYDIEEGREIIWMSERDGWNHLYRYDSKTGNVINQVTKGEWVVRQVVHVDEKEKRIILAGSGHREGEDPYHIHYFSVRFDGTDFRELTDQNASHTGYFNKDYDYFVDVYSRMDQAPQAVLRDMKGQILMELEKADTSTVAELGWQSPEVFSAKGRDGKTDIWGVIIRPTNFDPAKKYPVIENIYAGPHGSFVPKTYSFDPGGMQTLAELGFIVVQIDGMGTSHRSKAFHDVCWKNLKDAGFPDRILWMKAAGKKYPYMDLDRVGIYGTSAGGQSAAGALLFHYDFYKVAVSASACHDNRMDKIWWNEQWMGWPVGPHYAASSNVENADKMQGKLMLLVGELDDNVDPSSTYQFCNALIQAKKDFELVLLPGQGHTSGGDYGERKRRDFFVRHLLGVDPPEWD